MAGNPLPRSRIGSDRWSGRGFALAVSARVDVVSSGHALAAGLAVAAGGGGLAVVRTVAAAPAAVAAGGGGFAMSPAAAAVAVAAGGGGLAMSPAAAAVAVAAGGSGLPGRLPAETGGLRALSCPLQRARRPPVAAGRRPGSPLPPA